MKSFINHWEGFGNESITRSQSNITEIKLSGYNRAHVLQNLMLSYTMELPEEMTQSMVLLGLLEKSSSVPLTTGVVFYHKLLVRSVHADC